MKLPSSLLLVPPFVAAAAFAGQETLLDSGLRQYWNGEYEATVKTLEGECASIASRGEKIECFSYVAFSHIALGREEDCREAFVSLLTFDPAYRLDTELVSPKVVDRFEAAGRHLAETWFEEAKRSYAERDYASAIRVLDRVLTLDDGHELAREYRQLSEERRLLEAKLAEASAPPEPPEPVPEPVPEEKAVYHVNSEVQRPVLLRRVDPEYPRNALLRREEGSVVVSVVIDETGSIRESKVLRSVSDAIDRAALEAISQWRYRPATRKGVPVAVYSVIQLRFELQS